MSLAHQNFERILIIKPSSFGDIVHALPVLHGLRVRYPRARIGWLVATPFVEMLDEHPELDEVIPFDRKRFARLGRSPAISLEFLRFVRSLRARDFDLVLDLQGLFRSGFLARACGAKVRIGLSNAREMAWLFYTHRIVLSDVERHAADRNYRMADLLGFADVEMQMRLPVRAPSAARVSEKLREAGLSEGEPYAAVAPSARWETKMWPPDRFAKVVTTLRHRHDLRSVLLGSPDEIPAARKVLADSPAGTINLCGQTSLGEMVAALAVARIVICNDSGPMHVAAAFDRPLVAVFGPTNPVRTGPYRRMASVIRTAIDCSPCYLKKLGQCPHDHRCIAKLSVDQVMAAVETALAGNPKFSPIPPLESADMIG